MVDFIVGQLIGFVIGIVSSFLFWRYMLMLKPKVIVLTDIAYSPEDYKFRFKIGNGGRRQIIDIEISMFLAERKPAYHPKIPEFGNIKILHRYNLNRSSFLALEGKHIRWGIPLRFSISTIPKNDERNLDLDALFQTQEGKERRLVLSIRATDALSNTTYIQRLTFPRERIRYGTYLGLDYIPQEPRYLKQAVESTESKLDI